MDHREVNARFCDDLLAFLGRPPARVLDVGTGTALIPIELCKRAPATSVDAIDLAEHMLAVGRINVAQAGLGGRIKLQKLDAKKTGWGAGAFEAVVSNSIVHHIPDPRDVLAEMWRLVAPDGALFVRDLARPGSAGEVDRLVALYAAPTPGVSPEQAAREDRQRGLFAASLHAALTVDEVRAWVTPLGIPGAAVTMTSDRHWTLAARKT
jgi:ubiquinone/menaquinone biosynthesis C-methylase UbiE